MLQELSSAEVAEWFAYYAWKAKDAKRRMLEQRAQRTHSTLRKGRRHR